MSQETRSNLKSQFSDGERPSGADFANLLDSFLHKVEDGLELDAENNLVLSAGIGLGDSNRAEAGSLRLHEGAVQFHDGTEWVPLGSGGGVFEPAGPGGAVAYAGGPVGIGAAFGERAPEFALDVDLPENEGTRDRARFGTAVCSRGSGGTRDDAFFYQVDQDPAQGYALRQRANGEVFVNAPASRRIRIGQDNASNPSLGVTTDGNVVVRSANNLSGAGDSVFQVNGQAFKNTPSDDRWQTPSDGRLKEDVRDLDAGLAQLLRVRPVRFTLNGKAGVPAGREGVGIIGQEIEEVFPEMIQRVPARLDDETEVTDLRIFNGSAMTYVMINAIQELARKVEELEVALAGARGDGDDR